MGVQVVRSMLDRRITLNKTVITQDSFKGELKTVTNVEVWAKVEYKSGVEKETEDVITLDNTVVFTVVYRSLKEDDSITYEGKDYDIERIEEIGRHDYLKIHARRVEQ